VGFNQKGKSAKCICIDGSKCGLGNHRGTPGRREDIDWTRGCNRAGTGERVEQKRAVHWLPANQQKCSVKSKLTSATTNEPLSYLSKGKTIVKEIRSSPTESKVEH